jgi:hypothetical protein
MLMNVTRQPLIFWRRESKDMAVQLVNIPAAARDSLPQRFERKFYIAPDEVGLAYGLLRQVCLADTAFPFEQINSLYYDTAGLDQHERSTSGDLRKDKIRIRWYGKEEELHGPQPVFIELKSRQGFAGMKQRLKLLAPVENLTLNNLGKGIVPRIMLMETLAGFGFYLPEMLQPIIKVSYWRHRFSDIMTGQRVSLDYHIRSTAILSGLGYGEKELELPGAVLEIKGTKMELPVTLMRASILDTDWSRFSKYSACIDAHGETPGSIGRMSPSGKVVRR